MRHDHAFDPRMEELMAANLIDGVAVRTERTDAINKGRLKLQNLQFDMVPEGRAAVSELDEVEPNMFMQKDVSVKPKSQWRPAEAGRSGVSSGGGQNPLPRAVGASAALHEIITSRRVSSYL